MDVVEATSESLFEHAEDIDIQGLQHAGASGWDEHQPHALLVRSREDLLIDMRAISVETQNDLAPWAQSLIHI